MFLYQKWLKYAESVNIKFHDKVLVRANLLTCFCELYKCYNNNKQTKALSEYFNNNPDILVISVDKSKNLQILYTADYLQKLDAVFSDRSKFEKITRKPLDKTLRKLLNLF